MKSNIYGYAQDLEQAICNSEAYRHLKNCYEELKKDEAGRNKYDRLRGMQIQLQEKQMKGEEISQEEAQTAQKLQAHVEQDEVVSRLLEAERRMGTIINEVNGIISIHSRSCMIQKVNNLKWGLSKEKGNRK